MRRKRRKSRHSNKKTKLNSNNPSVKSQIDKKVLSEDNFENSDDLRKKKHKKKKNPYENLSFLDGLWILLLLKEIGFLDDEGSSKDEYKEFEPDKDFDISQKANSSENHEHDSKIDLKHDINKNESNYQDIQGDKKDHFDFDSIEEEYKEQEERLLNIY